MNIVLTLEHLYMGIILLLMGLQIRQHVQLEKTKEEVKKIWDQISIFNTMVAMKLLETQKDIDKLNNKENNNGE